MKIKIRKSFSLPVSTLLAEGRRFASALEDPEVGPPVLAEFPATFAADFAAQLAQVEALQLEQNSRRGEAAILAQDQDAALARYLSLASSARTSARLAFRDIPSCLHGGFLVGAKRREDLITVIARGRALVSSCRFFGDSLAPHGWPRSATVALGAAVDVLAEARQAHHIAVIRKETCTDCRNHAANILYRQCRTLQSVARRVFSPLHAADAGAAVFGRARYLLGEFPLRSAAKAVAPETPARVPDSAVDATPAAPAEICPAAPESSSRDPIATDAALVLRPRSAPLRPPTRLSIMARRALSILTAVPVLQLLGSRPDR